MTQYAPDELYAAGDYPNQSKGEEGLPAWTKADRKVREQDVVLWYTMNVTHIPRPEEWPVMSTTRYGLKLLPAGFFEQNPSMDVPLPNVGRVTSPSVQEEKWIALDGVWYHVPADFSGR